MRSLLDINVVVALLDSNHTHHVFAHSWWKREKTVTWASCPLTENGVVRIMSNPGYDRSQQHTLKEITARLRLFIERTDHHFWDDNISILDGSVFELNRIYGYRQITDSYLLALATVNQARFITFDRGVVLPSVKNATKENLLVI